MSSLTNRQCFELYLSWVWFRSVHFFQKPVFLIYFYLVVDGSWWNVGYHWAVSQADAPPYLSRSRERNLSWTVCPTKHSALYINLLYMLQYCWHKMLQVSPPCYKCIIYKMFRYHDRVATHLQKHIMPGQSMGFGCLKCFLHKVCDDELLYMFTSVSLLLAVSMVRSILVVSVATFASG